MFHSFATEKTKAFLKELITKKELKENNEPNDTVAMLPEFKALMEQSWFHH